MNLAIQNLTLTIAEKTICEHLNADFKAGEIWGILGSNGAGKTTLLKSLCGLVTPLAGDIRVNNTPLHDIALKQRAKTIGLLPQDQDYLFPSTVRQMVLNGRHPHCSILKGATNKDYEKVDAILQALELDNFSNRDITTLSGGEKRRVAIGTLLAQEPTIYLLDEPCNHLDIRFQLKILDHFKYLAQQENKLIIMVQHDLNLTQKYCDNVMLLFQNDHIRCGPKAELLTEQQLSELYDCSVKAIGNLGFVV